MGGEPGGEVPGGRRSGKKSPPLHFGGRAGGASICKGPYIGGEGHSRSDGGIVGGAAALKYGRLVWLGACSPQTPQRTQAL